MRVRALDIANDWTFGKGKQNYKTQNQAVAQNISTRLRSFLGDCFFDINAGIDWFNLLGSKDQFALTLSIRTTIINTAFVTRLVDLSTTRDGNRNLLTTFDVFTTFTDPLIFPGGAKIITDLGDILITDDGDQIIT